MDAYILNSFEFLTVTYIDIHTYVGVPLKTLSKRCTDSNRCKLIDLVPVHFTDLSQKLFRHVTCSYKNEAMISHQAVT